MPQTANRNRRYTQQEKDNCCFEVFMFLFLLYCTIQMWIDTCTTFFNTYCITSYTMMITIRRYQSATLEELDQSRAVQIIMMGVMMPIFFIHTYLGGEQFFTADKMTCRMIYQGEVFYIIIFMFAISMCLVFLLLLMCVLIPTWSKNAARTRRRRELNERLQSMDGVEGDTQLN